MQRAKKPFFAPGRQVVRKGELFADDDPIIEGREALFEHIEVPAPAAPAKPAAKRAAGRKPGGGDR